MKFIIETILDWVYPPHLNCLVCEKPLKPGERDVCGRCIKDIEYISDPCCVKCGKPLYGNPGVKLCHDCNTVEHVFTQAASVGIFEGTLKQMLFHFKFKGKTRLAGVLGELMSQKLKALAWPEFDAVIPVPLSSKRFAQRGYNQSQLLAAQVATRHGIRLAANRLVKTRDTRIQRKLNREERMRNLKDTFCVKNSSQLKQKRVLLIDDIYTTGATVNECSRVLIENYVKEVYVLTAASGKGF